MTAQKTISLQKWYVNDFHPEKACYNISTVKMENDSVPAFKAYAHSVCTVFNTSPECLERAHILAAAPELLMMVNDMAVLLAGVDTKGISSERAKSISDAVANASSFIDSLTKKEICFD